MFQLLTFEEINSQIWDDFVLSQHSGSIHQISTWKDFQEKIPGRDKVLGFALTKSKEQISNIRYQDIQIACLCVKREVGFKNKFWFYSPRGPVFREDISQEALDYFITEVRQELKKEGAMFWRLDPYFSLDSSLYILGSKDATQEYQPTDSLILDITGTEDEILAQMKRKGRYNIKLAREKGVEIEIIPGKRVTPEIFDLYWDLSQETAGRDGFQTHDKAYHEAFVRDLAPYTVIGRAKYEGQVIAGVINTYCGKKGIYYFGASSGNAEVRPLMAPYLLQWEMIRLGKEKGCETYDFTGITPIDQPDHPYKGITQFKEKFGGERSTMAGAREIVLQKGWYFLYRIVKWLKPRK